MGFYWLIFAFGFFLIIRVGLPLVFFLIRKRRLILSGISEVDRMSGREFELYLLFLFEKLGFKIECTKCVGDYGADLIAQKNGTKYVIQAKRYKWKVGLKAVQEVVAAKGMYKSSHAFVVTNSYFTSQAQKLALANQVELWDRDKLISTLLSLKDNVKIESHPHSKTVCDDCGVLVSERVKQYCLNRPTLFEGQIYCYDHQKRWKKKVA